MKGVKLISREEAVKRAEHIAEEYGAIYGLNVRIKRRFVPLEKVFPTQAELSEEKLLVVLQEIKHGYDAPLIVIPYGGSYYLLDGHHRAFALRELGFREAEALVLVPDSPIVLGVVRTARKMGMKKLEDMKIRRG